MSGLLLRSARGLGALFVAAAMIWSAGWASAQQQFIIEGEEPYPYGIQPQTGETQAELNQRLLRSFGEHPYGKPQPKVAERRAERKREIRQKAAEELRELQIARAEREARWRLEDFVEGAVPSRRSLVLDSAHKNKQMIRDMLEIKLRRDEIDVAELEAAAMGLYDSDLVWGINAPPVFGSPASVGGGFGIGDGFDHRRFDDDGGFFDLPQRQGGYDAEILERYSHMLRAERMLEEFYR